MAKEKKEKKESHRPFKYGEPTELVPVRVPVSKKKAFKEMAKKFLNQFIIKK